jgi:hypothetical protein
MRSIIHDIEFDIHDHHYMVRREHQIKSVVTVGCVISAITSVMWPQLQLHAVMLTITTNVIWIWS